MRLTLAIVLSGAAALAAAAEIPVTLPTSPADLQRGGKLFQVHCALCHGTKGDGGRGPMLARAELTRAPDDGALVKVIQGGIRGTEMPGAEALSDLEARQTAAYVRSLGKVPQQPVPGDPANGATVYAGKAKCAACHSIRGEGGIVGPDLSTIGESRGPAYLLESVVDPGAAVPEEYLLVTVTPKGGTAMTGVRLNEDSFSIQIRDDRGRVFSYWKKDLAKLDRMPGKTVMPSYKGQLSDAELTDLVAYLASLRGAK
jgi:putative heme-binding domain-containing protein